MSEMSSRERVVTALQHEEPDRVPLDISFGYQAYDNLRRFLGFRSSGPLLPSGPDLTVRPPADFLQAMNIDLFYVGLAAGSNEPKFEYGSGEYSDEWQVRYERIEQPAGLMYEARGHPLRNATKEDLKYFPWPDPYDPARTEGLAERCGSLYEHTDFAIVGRFNTAIFEQALMLRGYEQFLIDLMTNLDFAHTLLDRLTEIAMGMLEVGVRTAGRYLQILRLAGDDMGHQSGTILSPSTFRAVIKPRFRRLYAHARSLLDRINPDVKIMAHTDGDVYAIIPDYIDMGLDVLNPVQPRVTNMDHPRLKREFGRRLSFHGGIDIQQLMPFGTVDEVKRQAKATMRALGVGGGYILAPTHYLLPDVPPENILALRDAVVIGGRYPL
jgi:uroporphyrinogen decarboxylase